MAIALGARPSELGSPYQAAVFARSIGTNLKALSEQGSSWHGAALVEARMKRNVPDLPTI